MRLTSFLGVCHNLCSEFVLDVGRLKEISTTFTNSMKIALNFIVKGHMKRIFIFLLCYVSKSSCSPLFS